MQAIARASVCDVNSPSLARRASVDGAGLLAVECCLLFHRRRSLLPQVFGWRDLDRWAAVARRGGLICFSYYCLVNAKNWG